MNRRRFLQNVTGNDVSRLILQEEARYARMDFQDKEIAAEALTRIAERYLAGGGLEKIVRQLGSRDVYAQTLRACDASDEVIDRVLRRAERFFTEHLRAGGVASMALITGDEKLLRAEKRFLLCHGRIVAGCRAIVASFENKDQPERIFRLKTEIRFLLARLTALEADVVLEYFRAMVL